MRARGVRPEAQGDGAAIGARIADALRAACAPGLPGPSPVPSPATWPAFAGVVVASDAGAAVSATGARGAAGPAVLAVGVEGLVQRLFEEEGHRLVRLARLLVDDRNAAEDLVQEGFIRLARNVGRIEDPAKAAAYLRSIVLNLARDHNRRGLVSLRHHLPFDDQRASTEDEIVLRDDQHEVVEALREIPHRQRDCLVLRYYDELGIDDIAATLGISRNSVKTHLRRGLAAMETQLGAGRPLPDAPEVAR